MNLLVFCCDPCDPPSVDEAYRAEAEAAAANDFDRVLVDYESLVNEDNPRRATRRVPMYERPTAAIYRGWMLTVPQYASLYDALLAKGLRLLNAPSAYRHCHWLPESYPVIEDCTPKSVWMPFHGEIDIDRIMDLLKPFGSDPVIVKDFVKSRKHEWEEACFISSASNRDAVKRVVRRFVELQGEDLAEGLVFRQFVEFEPLTQHSKSGMPLTMEYRLFWLDGQPIYRTKYWEEGDYGGLEPPVENFRRHAERVRSRFFTMDVAKIRNGDWMIVELGDGQVAGLPEHADVTAFYSTVQKSLARC